MTLKLAAPAPFVLNGLASLPIVCPSGMDDRKSLAQGTAGTGPYELTEAAPGEQYTYQIRDGYTWGPNGATTATEGMPATIVMKIVQNETTSANLLLSGDLNAARSSARTPSAWTRPACSPPRPRRCSASSGTTTPKAARRATPTSGWR